MKEYRTAQIVAALKATRTDIAAQFGGQWELENSINVSGEKEAGIVDGCASSNTFRAFAHMPERPSVVFREWAWSRVRRAGFAQELAAFGSAGRFDRWHSAFCGSFVRTWRRRMGRDINFGPGRKLPNLLLESLANWSALAAPGRSRLIRYLHLPIDGFILAALRACIDDFVKERVVIGRIPRGATMSYIDNKERYVAIQSVARRIARKAGVPTIYIDKLVYGGQHPGLE